MKSTLNTPPRKEGRGLTRVTLGILMAVGVACTAGAGEDVFTNINQAQTGPNNPTKALGWEDTRVEQWFQTTNLQNIRQSNKVTVTLDSLPSVDTADPSTLVDVYGGFGSDKSDTLDVRDNIAEAATKTGSYFTVTGGLAWAGKAVDNTAHVKGNAIHVTGGFSRSGEVSGNHAILEDSTLQTTSVEVITVYGGQGGLIAKNNIAEVINSYSEELFGARPHRYSVSIPLIKAEDVTGNKAILRGNSTVGLVAGAMDSENKPYDKGNSILINGTAHVRIMDGFDSLTVDLTKENQQTAALTYEASTPSALASWPNGQSLSNRKITVTLGPDLNCCGTYKIIAKQDAVASIPISGADVTVNDALIQRYWKFASDAKAVDYLNLEHGLLNGQIADRTEKTPRTKILGESLLASLALVNQGAEFIADEGLNAMTAAAQPQGPVTFGAVHGGSNRYETGSHVDLKGGALAAGVANRYQALTYAGFIESGWASSASHVEGTAADGDHNYYGVGAALRFAAAESFHVDAAARLGWAKTKFSGAIADSPANYDSTALYFTGHVGAGYVVPLSKTVSAEAYARYVYSILNGDKTTVKNYDYETKAAHTHAVRVGLRLRGTVQETVAWRVGTAWEHVFGGEAKSQINCGTAVALDAPSLAGDTGMVEVGTTLKPSAQSPWSFDLGVKGYAGDRRGVTGNAAVLYRF